jgi:hypothetical protein
MKFKRFTFGSLRIDDVTYEKDLIIDRGKVRKRKKKASRKHRDLSLLKISSQGKSGPGAGTQSCEPRPPDPRARESSCVVIEILNCRT